MLTTTGALLHSNLRQVVYFTPHVLQSLGSISWYRCKISEGNGRLCKRCGLLSITLNVSSLPAYDHVKGDEHCTRMLQRFERAMRVTPVL